MDLLFGWLRVELGAGRPVVTEANFDPSWADERFAALPSHRALQIHCSAPPDVLLARYGNRERHPGHLGVELLPELREALADNRHRPLALGGDLIELDTSGERVEVDPVLERARLLLGA
jgi:hypothetical protein